jgi:hydrogenase maturation factor HypE
VPLDASELDGLLATLEELADRLDELAYTCLKDAAGADDPTDPLAWERRLRRARRALERAKAALTLSESD